MDLESQHWVVTAALVTSSLIALVANLLLLLVFCRRRGLRTVSNRFTINLLVTNLLSSVLLIPLLIVDDTTTLQQPSAPDLLFKEIIEETVDESRLIINDKLQLDIVHTSNNTLCYVAQSTVGFVCTASILSVLLIGIDQYFAVIHSLRYHSYIDKLRSTILILSAWFVSVFFAILSGLSQNASNLWQFCSRTETDEDYIKILNSIYAVVYFLTVVLAPFVAICVIYVCIYSAAHNSSERMRQSTKGNEQTHPRRVPSESRLDVTEPSPSLQRVQSAPNISNLVDSQNNVKRSCSERVGFISHLKHRLSNASVFRYREETRAAKISILVIFMVLACYVPYGLAVVLNSYIINMTTPQSYNYAAVVLLMLSNIVSPFLFAYRNRRIRRELLKFLKLVRPKKNPIVPIESQRRRTLEDCKLQTPTIQPFLASTIPEVIITYKVENDKSDKSILKRVCSSTKKWPNYKKCNFITVPPSCYQTDSARGSFSSASTQISTDD
ncbi:hypothetical protein RI129_012417 [Pyrocoelia pectoralis]|uniref:G-protein coupled receptors family 1 profile domain-containing protein n=1 Tax=Pyrocoelia pectoralis TaxID=417401 RepID=A0AAN7ZC38_9COLE